MSGFIRKTADIDPETTGVAVVERSDITGAPWSAAWGILS